MSRAELAVVVASEHGLPYLVDCLDTLERNAPEIEVIVAAQLDDAGSDAVSARFPAVKVISFESPMTIPQLRAAGTLEATAPYIALIEDPCRVLAGWASGLLAAHGEGHEVVGGPIRNRSTRIRDWAAFFCEYSDAMDPSPRGEVRDLPGMNISYSRSAVCAFEDLLRLGHWESWLHPRLRESGFRLWREPAAVVEHAMEFGPLEFAGQCWHHARSHGSVRNAALGRMRIVYAGGSPLIPIVRYLRIARNVLSRRSHVREFVLATPLIVLYNAVWGAGEAVGYVFGDPGRSRER